MLTLLFAPLAIGILGGYAFGGRLGHFVRTKIRAIWLLWLAAALQFFHFEFAAARQAVEERLGFSLMIPVFGLVGAWLCANLPGRSRAIKVATALIMLGGLMNAAAIAANGRMPFAPSAVQAAHESAEQQARGERSPKHVAAHAGTHLRWLGDVIPVAPIRKVVSAGDLVLLAGVAALVGAAMQPGGPPAYRRRRTLISA